MQRTILLLLVLVSVSFAETLQFQRIQPHERAGLFSLGSPLGTSGENNTIKNHQDIRYSANITLGGRGYVVLLDTGSTDLWLHGAPQNYNNTNIPLELRYGDGSYGVNGTIGLAPFEMGTFNISQQAFLLVESGTIGGLDALGIDGLLGLSFDIPSASPLSRAVKSRDGENTTWGNSVLKNIFSQGPERPNFIALDLSRTDDLGESSGGTFSIGEYADKWAAVSEAPKLLQYPKGGDRWSTLLEGITVGGTSLNLTSQIRDVPAGQLVTLLDTGDPAATVPSQVQSDIYSLIPGAVSFTQDNIRYWFLPCNTTTLVEFTFGGQRFPMHPLDLSFVATPIAAAGKEYTACVASMQVADQLAGAGFEVSLGDVFLRSVYSVYDFGDTGVGETEGQPYMQLLSQVNAATATSQVESTRNRTMATLPPEIPPADLLRLLKAEDPTISDDSLGSCGGPVVRRSLPIPMENLLDQRPSVTDPYSLFIVVLFIGNIVVGLALLGMGALHYARQMALSRRPTRSGPHYVPAKYQWTEGLHYRVEYKDFSTHKRSSLDV